MPELYTQPSFAAGEVGPELYGRVDQQLYYIGLRTCRNMIVHQYGGVSNRPGGKIVSENKDQGRRVKLVPFSFNDEQTYVLQVGENYTRFIRNGGEILETSTEKNITAITKSNPVSVSSTSHGFSDGDDVYISGVEGMVELNGRTLRVNNATANSFELTDSLGVGVDSTDYSTYTAGGTVIKVYEIASPWEEDDLFTSIDNKKAINYAQKNDILTIVHNDYYPRDLTRTDHDAWTVSEFSNVGGPFQDINTTATTVYSSAATGSVTLTASSDLFTADMVGELFYIEQEPSKDDTDRWEAAQAVNANDVRRAGSHYYEAQNSATTGTYRPDWTEGNSTDGDGAVEWEYLHSGFGIVQITGFTSATVATGTVISRLPDLVVGSGNTTDNWAKAAWSESQGYPGSCAYHKQRFSFGGTNEEPNVVWMSGVGLRSDFTKSFPVLADEAITLPLNTVGSNAIRHLLPFAELIALTNASEHLINGVDDILSGTGDNYNKVQGYTGSSHVVPIIINDTAIFTQDVGGVVRSLKYRFDSDSFGGIDLTARSPHLFKNRFIVDWSYQRYPFSIVWVVLDDGTLLGFTFMEEQEVFAWHRHDSPNASFESVACVREGNETATYFAVKRTINGQTRRYVERMASRSFTDVRDGFFVDSGLTYDGRNTSSKTMTITGGTTWDAPEELTITASNSTFLDTDANNSQIIFWVNDTAYRLDITAVSSDTIATVVPQIEIPAAYRSTAFTDWELAKTVFQPLHHLEGESVSIFADGSVVSGKSVSAGKVTIEIPASVVHIGLPYVSDFETLDIAAPQGQTKGKTFHVPKMFLTMQDSRATYVSVEGLAIDDTTNDLRGQPIPLMKQREPEDGYDRPIPAETKMFEVYSQSSWNKNGRISVRHVDPTPITINAVTPEVKFGSD